MVAAEWTKLAGLRSTWWVVVGTVGTTAALAWVLGLFARSGDGRTAASLVVAGHLLAQLGPLTLGALVGAGEHSAGTATTTYTAVPRRLPVLVAQGVVTTVVTLAAAVAAVAASALVTAGTRATAGTALDLADGETVRVLAGFVLDLTGVALLGLGLGALLRRPAAALVSATLLLVVVDHLLATNPGQAADTARALLPGAGTRLLLDDAGLAALDAASLGPHLGAWGGGLVLGAWVAGVLAVAAYRLRRGDVT
ncbi:hypothetical protein [Isoptericola cucumis]|uniref:hypothetical protein n=1 Tax=Isoptericola cucumis TaxID=1776856 RepID=UPI001E285684|nr:hypothetical protein [Isoptericola cucumis]